MFKLLLIQNVSRMWLHEAGTTQKDQAQDTVPSLCPPDCVYGEICEMGPAVRKGSFVIVLVSWACLESAPLSMWAHSTGEREREGEKEQKKGEGGQKKY